VERLKLAALVVAVLGSVVAGSAAQAQEEQSIKAFAAWQGRGQMYETGPDRATFVGSLAGIIFVETDKGPLDAGYMICPAFLDVNVKDGTQEGKGRCTISAKDGSRAYAELSCKGVHLVGCDGEFTFTGGTDRFEGLTGGGPITIRSGIQDFVVSGENTVHESAGGIIIWPKLTYKLAKTTAQ
jgi:hypothetical protein